MNSIFFLDWYDYGARFYDPEIGRFHTGDKLAALFSYQSQYVYAANNPICYIDYLGLGPSSFIKNVFNSIRGWFRDNVLNQTPTHGLKRVEPKKEERKVVYTERITVIPSVKFFLPDNEVSLPWGDTIIHHSGFDYSKFRHVKSYGLKFNVSESGLTIYQVDIPVILTPIPAN
ncbi:MAG: hypothetical protein KGZ97_11350 [Bacteroidetes bacterium]|nr:hypothetical protein [Bacteroidota bacterium]